MRVEVELQADWEFGLIQRKLLGDKAALAEVETAYFAIIAELRSGNASIWSMASEQRPDAFVCYYPPLHGHFRKIDEDKVAIFSFTKMEWEGPGGDMD